MVVKIYNVFVEYSHIIGVSAFRTLHPMGELSVAFYKKQFEFDVYLVSYKITVSTDLLSFSREDKEESIEHYKSIKEAWEALRDNLLSNDNGDKDLD